jgi:DNA-binding response OmpR family regulator
MHRVLLADDARLLVELEQTALGRSNWELVTVRPHDDIVTLVEQLRPSAIVLMDGEACPDALEICRRLKTAAEAGETPVVYVGLGLERQRYLEAGVDVFLPRPVRRHDLREAIRRVLPVPHRAALRRPVDLPVAIEGEQGAWSGRVVDLSLTGAKVRLETPVEVGLAARAAFRAGTKTLRLQARVVREARELHGEGGYGIQFERVDAETAVFLSRFVRAVGERRGSDGAAKPARSGSQ